VDLFFFFTKEYNRLFATCAMFCRWSNGLYGSH